jgi:hypothetical protein
MLDVYVFEYFCLFECAPSVQKATVRSTKTADDRPGTATRKESYKVDFVLALRPCNIDQSVMGNAGKLSGALVDYEEHFKVRSVGAPGVTGEGAVHYVRPIKTSDAGTIV